MAKRKKKTTKSKAAATQGVVEIALNKQHGDGTIINLGNTNPMMRFPYQIPTGCLGLDISIGPLIKKADGLWQHGLPGGFICEMFGPEGSGKTTLCMQIIANAQRMGLKCAFLDSEHAVQPDYARRLGVRLEDLTFSQPTTGEQAASIAEALIKSRAYGVIVVDSVAAMVPEAELNGEIGDSHVGLQARLMSQMLRMIRGEFGEGGKTLVIFTNQIRMKIGVMYGNPETTPGGRALKFYSDFRIDLRPGAKFADYEGGPPVGQVFRSHVIKNKVDSPYRKAEANLYFGEGTRFFNEVVDLAVQAGVLVGSGWYEFDGIKLQGYKQWYEAIRASVAGTDYPGLAYKLYDALLTKLVAARGYSPNGRRLPTVAEDHDVATPITEAFRVPQVVDTEGDGK